MESPTLNTRRGQMPKLDLMNHRFFYKNENYRIHDSCEDLNLSTLSTSNGKTGLRFSRQLGREIYKSQEIYHSNELVDPPPKNHRGDYVSCLESSIHSPLKNIISEKLTNSFELFNNDAALIYHTATRLNKSTKEAPGNAAESQIWKDIQAGKVNGGRWSAFTTNRKPLMDIPTHLGPGDYDLTKWERSQFGPQQPSVKFNNIETDRLELKFRPVDERCPSPTSYFVHTSPLPPLGTRAQSFPQEERFRGSSPNYVRTTGMTLSHDFDRHEGWREGVSPVNISLQSSPRPTTEPGFQFGVDFINPDTGSKITIKTEVEKSPRKYAAIFKSKAEVGFQIPPSQCGTVGPGEYRGACDKSSLEIKLPHNLSSPFLTHRHLDPALMNTKYSSIRPRFSRTKGTISDELLVLNATVASKNLSTPKLVRIGHHRQRRRVKISTTTESEQMKLSHIAMWTKTKMNKIYPKLAKQKFGD